MSTSADNKNGDHYRIPLRWSKAWTMEPGCSDIRATNNCSTSMRLSSCGREGGLEAIVVFQGEQQEKYLVKLKCVGFRWDILNYDEFLVMSIQDKSKYMCISHCYFFL